MAKVVHIIVSFFINPMQQKNKGLSMNKKRFKITIRSFSLAEMIVVTLILSIIIAASMPIITKKATQAAPTSSSHGKQLFTSNGTFNVPNGVNKIWVSMTGGGGGYYLGYSYSGGAGAQEMVLVEW